MSKEYKQPEEAQVEDVLLKDPMFLGDLIGTFQTVTAVPTIAPRNVLNQIKFYSNSTTYRIYIYDLKNAVWRYATLT